MIFKIEEKNKDVIPKGRLLHPLEISDFFHFALPAKEKYFLNYIDLFFKVEGSLCPGNFSIDVVVNNKSTSFSIPHSSLRNDTPLRLLIESHPYVENKIDVLVKARDLTQPLYLWIDETGPCVTVNGDAFQEVSLDRAPLISIVTPLYESSLKYLTQAISSVQDQIYTNWELCLVDDGTGDTELSHYLHGLRDPRIKTKINRKNRGISEATNIALEMATGDFICFLDHDDLLTREALLEVVSVINEHPGVKLVYTDEDKVTEDGRYVEHFFKPDWSYHMLLSQNYVCHLSTYRADVLKKIQGVRPGYEGSQDHDLVLRALRHMQPNEIRHIPKILYHWRKHEGSTSSSLSNKPYAHLSGLLAVKDHLNERGEDARVTSGRYLGSYRVDYVMDHSRLVHIIIPTRDNPAYLRTCCFSIEQSTHVNYLVTIVDNGSTDPETKALLQKLNDTDRYNVLQYNKPFNYSAINNLAVRKGPDAEVLLFLNDDTEVISSDWLEQMAQHIGRGGVAAVGAKLLYGDNTIQHAGVIIGMGGIAGHSHKKMPDGHPGYFMRPHVTQNVTAVTGACMMVDRKVFEDVGGFEESLPRAFNDVDLCLKIREKGHYIVYTPYACLYHHESVSRGLDNSKEAEFAKAIEYMDAKWGCSKYVDPYYNPNLALVSEVLSYKIK
jgi:O-antigen biosynthesis protein